MSLFKWLTVFVVVVAAALEWSRWREGSSGAWPFVAYAILFGYAVAFKYSIDRWLVIAGFACALVLRGGIWRQPVRWIEGLILTGVVVRCGQLLLDR